MYMTQGANMFPAIYLPNGLKPAEAFFSDISQHLVRWATDAEDTTYYETKDYWYRFMFENTDVGRMSGIIWLRRFEIDSPEEMTVFTNRASHEFWAGKWHFSATAGNKVPVE